MESLRPERDELDRFNSRQVKAKKTKTRPTPPPQPAKSDRSGIIFFIALLLLGACTALGWAFMTQQKQLESLSAELNDARGFIGQSKLLMARFEGELNETGAEMVESGSEVEKKLAFLDSEMRKLWGVSNDRNKKWINDNNAAIAKLEDTVASLRQENKKLTNSLNAAQTKNTARLSQIDKNIASIETLAKAAASEIAVTRELINEEIDIMRFAIQSSEETQAAITENKKAIASIDASRLQLNERIVNLEDQLNSLRLQLEQKTTRVTQSKLRDPVVNVQ